MFQTPVNREVTATDVKYSWQRVLNPKTASPGVTFFLDIAGAQEYNAGKATDVSGLKVLGRYTLQIHLLKPYAPFQYVCAMPFAYVVPHEIVDKYPKDFSHHAAGTGPFILSQWVRDQQVVFVRNPNYWQKGLPYLDKVILKVVPQPSVAVLQVQRGEADVLTDDPGTLDYLRLKNDPRWRDRLFPIPAVSTAYIWMDTLVPPFTNRLVRQAVAMSIDKKRIIAVETAGRSKVTGGILPPLMPCYNSSLTTWPYDPARARKLLAQAGYPNGFSVTITSGASSTNQATVEQIMERDLARIGVKATIKIAAGSTYSTLISTPKAVQIAQTSWTLDFPDPSDFIDPILTGTSAVQGGSNFAFYSNPTVNALAAQADHTLNQAQRCSLYDRLEQIIVTDAPWVPLYTPVHTTLVAQRVTKFWMNPIWYAFDFAYYQVSK
jgi:ABC-type transport system substrate-binding protein